ncbi:hypothetical protein [Aquimarina sp. RZ0]|uniref:hypothetical protein n=1 Tax=Aquimarina sp. RZ0 TaxID=2607730 RepID=UPI0011F38B02|nr:hypothetical protein [Aquimarina sp. RZ0]KAA1246560.1 hypothetical protein F0000_07300 [Aquimarina sp. RZ0]
MKNSVSFKLRVSLCTLVLVAMCFSVNSQTPVTPAQNATTSKKQIYKKQQMFDSKTGVTDSKSKLQHLTDNAIMRAAYEHRRLKNPTTGKIPDNIRNEELQFSSKIAVGVDSKKSLSRASKSKKIRRLLLLEE